MDNLSNTFKTNLQKLLADNKIYINKKNLSSSIGYKTANSITKDLNGSKEPFWQKACKCIEYLYSNVPCFTLNNLIPTMEEKQEDKKSFAELEKDYKTLKSNYEQLEKKYNNLYQFANFINIIKNLSNERQDTLFNLMSAECFADFLTKLRDYSHRALIFDKNNKKSHYSNTFIFKPYNYNTFAYADALCQQTILALRLKYRLKNQDEYDRTEEEKKQKRIEEKINEIKITGKRRTVKMRIKNLLEETSNADNKKEFRKDRFNDLTRWKFNPLDFKDNTLWNYDFIDYKTLYKKQLAEFIEEEFGKEYSQKYLKKSMKDENDDIFKT